MRDFIKIPKKRLDELKSKKRKLNKLEKLTNTKISINEDIIIIDGEGIDIFQTKNILKAFGRGFSIDDSLYLLDEEYSLEIINLKDYTKSKNRMIVLKSRIIGTKGKTKKYIEQYTNTKISIYGKTISIIGKWDKVNIAKKAILMLIEGCSHTTLYKWLEQKC